MYKTKSNRKRRSFRRRSSNNQKSNAQSKDFSKYIQAKPVDVKDKKYISRFSFEDFGLDSRLLARIKDKNYEVPSEIQDKSIWPGLEGKDIVGIAGTGTGKTAAFLIPIVQKLLKSKMEDYALVIAPTRELATQIKEEFISLTRGMDLFTTCLIGGEPLGKNFSALKRRNHIIIGTPGRLQDMAKRNAINFDAFKVLVLDEFDRMLDMGFSKEITQINKMMNRKEQTLLYSATLDKTQKNLINEMTYEPIHVKAESASVDSTSIEQDVIHVKGQDKFQMLTDLLRKEDSQKILLFCETKRHSDKMSGRLSDQNILSDAIHGDKTQRAREKALRKFKRGQINVLVATDVVARGIDVKDVDLVINYEEPRSYTDYIHRIGRTGRAGKSGRALTFIG